MKTNENLVNNKFNIIIATLLVISSIFIFSGCSAKEEVIEETPVVINEVDKHDININPEPLTATNMELSLEGYGAIGALADTNLTFNDMLMYSVQDEYLAHGEYIAIIEKFGSQRPYDNIIKAEETHLGFLKEVYKSYNIDFPTDESASHIVIPSDLLEAAQTGVQAEIDNIKMYDLFLSYDLPENIIDVFSALKAGSESHLLAFQKQVDRLN